MFSPENNTENGLDERQQPDLQLGQEVADVGDEERPPVRALDAVRPLVHLGGAHEDQRRRRA